MKQLLCILFLTFNISFANAPVVWSKTGHRVIGAIAQAHLTKKATKAISKLLDGRDLATIANFSDEIKADTLYRKFSAWHYVNIPKGKKYNEVTPSAYGDLVVGVHECISIITNKTSTKKDKAFYLKMLVHLIGDLHQPMHVGRFEDKGGNDIKLQWFNEGTNLHRVWDSNLINQNNMSYTELSASLPQLSTNQKKAIQSGVLLDWVEESHVIADTIYESVEDEQKLYYRYSYVWWPTVEKQLQKGGLRLAKVLNDLF